MSLAGTIGGLVARLRGQPPAPAVSPAVVQSLPASTPAAAGVFDPADPNAAVLDIARPQIMRDEGCRLTAYPDPLSGGAPWTIGYGATGAHIGPGTCWTQDEATADLDARLEALCAALDGNLAWWRELDPPRGAVMVNMAYNMGLGGLLAFKNTLAAVKAGNYPAASAGMLASAWARQVGARASRLAMQMRTGQPQ